MLTSQGRAWTPGSTPAAAAAAAEPAPAPARPRTAAAASAAAETSARPAARGPRPRFSSARCRKAEPGAAALPPRAPLAERREPGAGVALGEDAGDDTWARGAAGISRRQRSSCSKMWRRNGGNGGANLRTSNVSPENLHYWNLDSEGPVPENKNLPPGRDGPSGGRMTKSPLEIPVEKLMLELTLSERVHKGTQNNKQGLFQLWSYPLTEGSTVESRNFKMSPVEIGLNVTNNPIRPFTLKHSLTSATVDRQVASYPGLQQQVPLGLCWPYADGDFVKDRNESCITLCSATESSSTETLSALNWDFKYGSSSVEENLTDESDLSENEKTSDTSLSYFKKMDLNLKPETIENLEESCTEEPSEVFPYPDFLPPPFNTLDLHKLALSKSENWKATMDPPESAIEHLINRLLEMERIQHMTIQKEKTRLQTSLSTPAVTERPSSSKAVPRGRQPKPSDCLSLQTSCVDKSQEKRKNSSGSSKLEKNASKRSWSSDGKYRWNSRLTSLKNSSTTKQLLATYDDLRNPPNSILNSCAEPPNKPSTAQTAQCLVKIVSARSLPARSPLPISPVPLSFPENHREEIKPPRTKKKVYQKNTVLNRPFCI